jgi:hypothetical protein
MLVAGKTVELTMRTTAAPVFIDRRITTENAMDNGYGEMRSFFHARPKSHGYSQQIVSGNRITDLPIPLHRQIQ